ncbi:TldD/PmbA family protein [Alkaliphilus serpentinus]|uniref:TldD/PmbA family protein n=1 Tax=Alkaliphilus serpentinus TaxID=1482731 RepID=A0A833M8V5_9FIRM|nr:TldD/PmbA family protein [Alkaliphilus serpentinus]KAB3531791.1 TldD/PmbA family protein [Alkaliphilus serpentinus]
MKKYDDLIKNSLKYAEELGIYLIIRIQQTKGKYVLVNNTKTEEISYNEAAGIGFHAFTKEGGCGFAATEIHEIENCRRMIKLAADIAFQMEKREGKKNTEVYRLEPIKDEVFAKVKYPFDYYSLEEAEKKVIALNGEILKSYSNIAIESIYRQVEDQWRIARSDGGDVIFNIPRTVFFSTITAKGKKTATTRAALSGSDSSILHDDDKVEILHKRIHNACSLAIDLLEANMVKGGNYKIVMDYALAKGLAHEAFGHAVESDGLKTSILGNEDGSFKKGVEVAMPIVSIIDEAKEGDYAYQPYSANGIKRRRVEIIKDGVLKEALADIFSAAEANVEVTGAGRLESFRHIPIPRMSNIRIEVKDPIELDKAIEDVKPEEIYKILLENNIAKEDEEILYLVGYKGGQVKPSQGEFVFNCSGIYKLGKETTLYQPAIFSGNILSALKSIIAAIGPLQLDAQGTCGKFGQQVPSSGGSHYFVVMEANKDIIIGGE